MAGRGRRRRIAGPRRLALEADGLAILVVDMVEQGLDQAAQEAVIARLRRRARGGRPLFLLTRSSAILDLAADEAIILCPANHSPPTRVALIRLGPASVASSRHVRGGSMSMPVRVIAQAWARPGKEAELKAALAALAEPSLAEPGCLVWEAYDDPQEPRRVVTVELWADDAALAAHMETPHVRAMIARADALLAVPPEIRSFRRIA